MRLRRLCEFTIGLALGLANAGCGSFMAHRLAQAPNSYPSWLAPRAPVGLQFGADYLARLPRRYVEVGPPAARLCYRLVEPGDYGLEVASPRPGAKKGSRVTFTFSARVPASPTVFTGSPRGTLLLLHCYGADHTVMAPWAWRLAQEGWRCVLVDLRGHGDSTGDQIQFGVREARDLSQLLDELRNEDLLVEPVTALGYSYGAALALRWETAEIRIRRVVAIAPYAELARSVLNVRRDYARMIPEDCLLAGLKRLPAILQVEPAELDTTTVLGRAPVTALFVAGGADAITPLSDVSRLHSLAGAGSRLLVVPYATHETLPYWMAELADPIQDWLARAPDPGSGTNRTPGTPTGE